VDETLPFTDFDRSLDPQRVVDHINEVGGIPILAHPYWSGLSHRDMMELDRYHGVEIYNTSCMYERNTGLSAVHVDGVLAAGRRPTIYAVDDHHGADRPTMPLDACGAWISVKAKSLSRGSIMKSIKEGLFYSRHRPRDKEPGHKGRRSHIRRVQPRQDHRLRLHAQPRHGVPRHGRAPHIRGLPWTPRGIIRQGGGHRLRGGRVDQPHIQRGVSAAATRLRRGTS